MSLLDLLKPRDLAKIRGLQLFARTVVEGFCTGLHTSPHKGFSVEFKQHRPYVPGDEIRRIDWKVFGRSDRYYIREFEEETNLRCTILLDASGSMRYKGTTNRENKLPEGCETRWEYARRLAACLSYLMLMQQDSVGLVTYDTKVRNFIPSRSRTNHLRLLLETMAKTEPGGENELGNVFKNLVPRLHRRGLVVIISDCFCKVEPLLKSLANMRHKGHEIVIFQLFDQDELTFPFKQWTKFVNLEIANTERLVDPASLRAAYLDKMAKFREELKGGCRRNRIELVPFIIGKMPEIGTANEHPLEKEAVYNYADALTRYLSVRMRQ